MYFALKVSTRTFAHPHSPCNHSHLTPSRAPPRTPPKLTRVHSRTTIACYPPIPHSRMTTSALPYIFLI